MTNERPSARKDFARRLRLALIALVLTTMAVKYDRRKTRWLVAHAVEWALGTLFVSGLAWCVRRWLDSP